ncbi:MAG: hypothetical protein AABX05_02785, partial [Nanoarchaeota archaeon]
DFPADANLYYSKGLNAVIYAKEGLSLSPGLLDKILNWFSNLFGTNDVLQDQEFLSKAEVFRDLYMLDKDGKKIRAVKEMISENKQTLVAEYENFDTPICDYVDNIKVPPELELELLEEVSEVQKLRCSVNDTIQKVEIASGLKFFWPQLTGKLRVGEN